MYQQISEVKLQIWNLAKMCGGGRPVDSFSYTRYEPTNSKWPISLFNVPCVTSTNPNNQYNCTARTCHITAVPSINPQHSVPLYCNNLSHYRSTVHKSPPLGTPVLHQHVTLQQYRPQIPTTQYTVTHQHVTLPQYRPQIPTTRYTCTAPTCHITTVPSTNSHHSVTLYRTNMSHYHSTVHKSPPLSTPVPHHVTSPQYRPQIPTTQ
jgi:hypothetical protein